MATVYQIPLWKNAPFIRLIIPLIGGIIFQYFFNFSFVAAFVGGFVIAIALFVFYFLSFSTKYKLQWLHGIFINAFLFCGSLCLSWQNDIRNNENWFAKCYTDSSTLIIKLTEPLTEKINSYKALGTVEAVVNNGQKIPVSGKILIYFSKNDSNITAYYGDKIIIKGGVKSIKNAGNPGGFNYSRYMGFQQTYHQVFVKKEDYLLVKSNQTYSLYPFIFTARKNTVNIIKSYVKGNMMVTGIAEALLIGYKEDLDKDLVQAYSNTGVVHIIAISGMHLGLIYVGLVWLFGKLPLINRSTVAQTALILLSLWIFSLITGASASVLRSAVMFSCIVIGKLFNKRACIYNSLASSAFLLLCFDTNLLWDVGFQLSYCAVTGIVWLKKPIENLFYSKYIGIQYLWEMCAITIAAQIITLPMCIYYFHQIPSLFLITNLVCVPLSTLILFAEIILIVVSGIPFVASIIGKFIFVLIWCMNAFINFCNDLPFSSIDKIAATTTSTIVLYLFIFSLTAAFLKRNKRLFKISIASFLIFLSVWGYGKITTATQHKIIVYHVNKHTAIDFVNGNKYWFYGDDDFKKEGTLQNFNLKPTRVLLQTEPADKPFKTLSNKAEIWYFNNKKIILINSAIEFIPQQNKITADALIISKNPTINIAQLLIAVKPSCIVFDGSNSLWKITQWKKECAALHLQYFNTAEQGAFVLATN